MAVSPDGHAPEADGNVPEEPCDPEEELQNSSAKKRKRNRNRKRKKQKTE